MYALAEMRAEELHLARHVEFLGKITRKGRDILRTDIRAQAFRQALDRRQGIGLVRPLAAIRLAQCLRVARRAEHKDAPRIAIYGKLSGLQIADLLRPLHQAAHGLGRRLCLPAAAWGFAEEAEQLYAFRR